MCDKRGLPLLLTRYAVAPDEAAAPRASGPFQPQDRDGTPIPLGGQAHYTLRLLRSGYLYVFDERRQRWSGYFVTPEAFLMPFEIGPAGPTGPAVVGDPAKIAPCNPADNGEIAGCITVPAARDAGLLWLTFSDVEWTPAVWQRHQNAGYRKQHMRAFDVARWLASGAHTHAAPIQAHAQHVAEYAPALKPAAFGFSSAPLSSRRGRSDALLRAAERAFPGKGAVLALDEPAGMAMDLAALMASRLKAFADDPARKHPLAASVAIEQLRETIAHQSEIEQVAEAERLQARLIGDTHGSITWTESGRKALDEIGKVSPAELDRAARAAWHKYEAKYSEPRRAAFRQAHAQALERFDREQVAPLALAHAGWMKSVRLARWFAANFDEADVHSGAVYTETLSACIGDTQDKKPCLDVYADWLNGSVTDKSNLILRGLLLNQDEYARVVSQGSAVSVDPRGLPWDVMIGNVGKGADAVLEGRPDFVGRFLLQIGGPLNALMLRAAEGGRLPQALIAAGVISKTPILRIELSGTLKDFQRHVISELLRARGDVVPPHGFKTAVERELRLLEIRGAKLSGTRSKKFLVVADLDALKAVPAGGKQTERARVLAKTLARVDDLERLELSRWRGVLARGTTVRNGVMPFAFSVLGAMAQWVMLGKLSEDLAKAEQSGKAVPEASARYWAGMMAFGGTLTETLGNALGKMPETALKFGRGMIDRLGWMCRVGGKALGLAGEGIGAFWDGTHAYDEMKKGNQGLAIAYGASALLGAAGAIIMLLSFASATGIGLLLVALAIGISILIEFIKDNPLQEWLDKCYFGKREFADAETEIRALQALAA